MRLIRELLLAWLCVGLLSANAWAQQSVAPTTAAGADAATDQLVVLSYHDVRGELNDRTGGDQYAISSQNFTAHLDWLAGQGYNPVSLQQVVDAARNGKPLPRKPVLLTFDDGLRSVYQTVYPLLRAYGYPAVVAVVSSWIDLPQGQSIDYGPRPFTHGDFLTWQQLREMQDSGLIEVVSHSHAMHTGIPANPQGNSAPAAITRRYDANTGRYEDQQTYEARVRADLARSSELIRTKLGRAPRAVVWPYAAYNGITNKIANELGMEISFDLEGRDNTLRSDLHGLSRILVQNSTSITELARELRTERRGGDIRALQIDMDDVYDADPVQIERNLDALIERVRQIRPTHVFLQAFADPDGNNTADALYFPNRHLPMRADLFNRVAWQLRTRSEVKVYAWLPVLGYEIPDQSRREALRLKGGAADEMYRLDFTNAEARQIVKDIYSDLGVSGYFEGLLFHDDGYLRDTELTALGQGEPAQRTQALIDFTMELTRSAELWRPKLKTVRNLFAQPLLNPESESWWAQQLDAFNRHYTYTAVMAMPWMEGAKRPKRWLRQLTEVAKQHDPDMDQTIFELQTVDWKTQRPIPERMLKRQVRELLASGVRHIAWYPDDFIANVPRLEDARESISARQFPYLER